MYSNTLCPREIFLAQISLNIQWYNTGLLQRKGVQASVLSAFFSLLIPFSFLSFQSHLSLSHLLLFFMSLDFSSCEGQYLEIENRQCKALCNVCDQVYHNYFWVGRQ